VALPATAGPRPIQPRRLTSPWYLELWFTESFIFSSNLCVHVSVVLFSDPAVTRLHTRQVSSGETSRARQQTLSRSICRARDLARAKHAHTHTLTHTHSAVYPRETLRETLINLNRHQSVNLYPKVTKKSRERGMYRTLCVSLEWWTFWTSLCVMTTAWVLRYLFIDCIVFYTPFSRAICSERMFPTKSCYHCSFVFF